MIVETFSLGVALAAAIDALFLLVPFLAQHACRVRRAAADEDKSTQRQPLRRARSACRPMSMSSESAAAVAAAAAAVPKLPMRSLSLNSISVRRSALGGGRWLRAKQMAARKAAA